MPRTPCKISSVHSIPTKLVNMRIKFILLFLLTAVALFAAPSAQCATPIDDWNTLILDGNSRKSEGKYSVAADSYTKAIALSQKEKLPPKYLPISLCHLTEVEVVTNKIDEADSHFQKIIDIIKTQKEAHILNPQVNFWAIALAEAYEENTKPATREICLKRACYLKNLVYGVGHKECLDCLSKLAEYYADNGNTEKQSIF